MLHLCKIPFLVSVMAFRFTYSMGKNSFARWDWRTHWVVVWLVKYYLNDVRTVWEPVERWNNPSKIHVDDEHRERNHRFSSSNYGQLCSMHTNNMMVSNRKHWHCFHWLAKFYRSMWRKKFFFSVLSTYFSINIFDQFIHIFKPLIGTFVLKITAHCHDNMIRSKAICLRNNRCCSSMFLLGSTAHTSLWAASINAWTRSGTL